MIVCYIIIIVVFYKQLFFFFLYQVYNQPESMCIHNLMCTRDC